MDTKKIAIVVAVIVVLGLGYYFLAPLVKKQQAKNNPPVATDRYQAMTQEEKKIEAEAIDTYPDKIIVKNDRMPDMPAAAASILKSGPFVPGAHDVAGKVSLIRSTGGKMILRFDDFRTVNGPELHIYLAKKKDGAQFIDLGPIQATKGNANYDLAELGVKDVNFDEYPFVLVWSQKFSTLFSSAEMTAASPQTPASK